jgi:hypothetical protein
MLVENNAVAFRASLRVKLRRHPYCTGGGSYFPTLTAADGMPNGIQAGKTALPKGQNPISYTVTLEPHHYRWLFVLEMPAEPLHQGRVSQ